MDGTEAIEARLGLKSNGFEDERPSIAIAALDASAEWFLKPSRRRLYAQMWGDLLEQRMHAACSYGPLMGLIK